MTLPYTVPEILNRQALNRAALDARHVTSRDGRELVRFASRALAWLVVEGGLITACEPVEGNDAVELWIREGLQRPADLPALGDDWLDVLQQTYGATWSLSILAQQGEQQLHRLTFLEPEYRELLLHTGSGAPRLIEGQEAFETAYAAQRGHWSPGAAPQAEPERNIRSEARTLLLQFLDETCDERTLIGSLAPDPGDYGSAFLGPAILHAQRFYGEAWSNPRPLRGRIAGRNQLLLMVATTEEIRSWSGEAREFPSGYQSISHLLAPGVSWVRWKFVQPGRRSGLAFDGLAHVNGRFVWFPKLAVALSELG